MQSASAAHAAYEYFLFMLTFCPTIVVVSVAVSVGDYFASLFLCMINIGNIVVITASARAFLAFLVRLSAILPLLLPLNGHVNI